MGVRLFKNCYTSLKIVGRDPELSCLRIQQSFQPPSPLLYQYSSCENRLRLYESIPPPGYQKYSFSLIDFPVSMLPPRLKPAVQ